MLSYFVLKGCVILANMALFIREAPKLSPNIALMMLLYYTDSGTLQFITTVSVKLMPKMSVTFSIYE